MADKPETELAGFVPTYVTTSSHPAGRTPSATIYLHGLLCLCFDFASSCSVAVVEAKNHLLTFGVWDKNTCSEVDLSTLGAFNELEIDVVRGGAVVNQVNTYNGAPFSTAAGSAFPAEARWSYADHCLDLGKAHSKTLKARLGKLKKRFHIGNGLFSVCKLTQVDFELRNPTDPMRPSFKNKIGLVLAADLFLNDNDVIKFAVKGGTEEASITWRTGDAYEIKIDNSCSTKTGACTFEPSSLDEIKRNDFHAYNGALDVPARFELWSTDPGRGTDEFPKIGHCPFGPPFSDRAPCMPAGLGMTPPGDL
jgi:hypothetical protein